MKINKNNDKRILLVGGGGYVGSTLAADFLASGYEVSCLDSLVYGNSTGILPFLSNEKYNFFYGDMNNKIAVEKALEGVTDVILLAGLVGDPITKKYPKESAEINDKGVKNVIDQINGRGIQKFIFISTCSNYGMIQDDKVADETYPLNPLSLYAKSKVNAEKYIMSLEGRVDYSPVILRFSTAFGISPRMRFDLSISEFAYELAVGNQLLIFDALTWRPYCHVKDFGRLIEKVLCADNKLVSFNIFNAGGDENNSTKEGVISIIRDLLPKINVKYQDHGSDPRNYRVNFEKVRRTLEFTPRYGIKDGVLEVVKAVEAHVFDDVSYNRNKYGNHELIERD